MADNKNLTWGKSPLTSRHTFYNLCVHIACSHTQGHWNCHFTGGKRGSERRGKSLTTWDLIFVHRVVWLGATNLLGGQLPHIPSITRYSLATSQIRNTSEKHALSVDSYILASERRVGSSTAKINFVSCGTEPDFAESLPERAARENTGLPSKCPMQNVPSYTKQLYVVYLKFKFNLVSHFLIC